MIARGRAVRRSKTETKIYRDATISSATITRDKIRRRRKMEERIHKNINNMPTRLTTICPEEYHANRSAQETWIFERGGKRLLESEDEDPFAHKRKTTWLSVTGESISGLKSNVENLCGITKRAVARMLGQ